MVVAINICIQKNAIYLIELKYQESQEWKNVKNIKALEIIHSEQPRVEASYLVKFFLFSLFFLFFCFVFFKAQNTMIDKSKIKTKLPV